MANDPSMDSILSDEKTAPEAKEDLHIPVLGEKTPEAEKTASDEQRKEDYKSRRNKARDKEAEAQGKVRDLDTGQYVSPKESPDEPVAKTPEPVKPTPAAVQQQEFTDREKAFLRATQEERGKRQDLERRIAAIEAAKTQPTEPAKTFWDDPDAAFAKQRQEETRHLQEMKQVSTNARLNTAEQIARARHPDFEEKLAIFSELIEKNPGLAQPWIASADPAEFVYATAKNHKELLDAGGVDALRAKIEKETEAKVRVKIEAELRAKSEALENERAALPGSLSDARSSGTVNRPSWGGIPSMEDILK